MNAIKKWNGEIPQKSRPRGRKNTQDGRRLREMLHLVISNANYTFTLPGFYILWFIYSIGLFLMVLENERSKLKMLGGLEAGKAAPMLPRCFVLLHPRKRIAQRPHIVDSGATSSLKDQN